MIFKIILPNEFWLKYKTPGALVDEVCWVDDPLFLNSIDSKNQWDIRNNKKLYWPSKNPLMAIKHFLNNVI